MSGRGEAQLMALFRELLQRQGEELLDAPRGVDLVLARSIWLQLENKPTPARRRKGREPFPPPPEGLRRRFYETVSRLPAALLSTVDAAAALATHCDEGGITSIRNHELAELTGWCEPTIVSALRFLRADGWVENVVRSGNVRVLRVVFEKAGMHFSEPGTEDRNEAPPVIGAADHTNLVLPLSEVARLARAVAWKLRYA